MGELVNSVSLLFVLALPTLMVVACGSNEVKRESERTKKIEQQEGKQSHGEQQQEPTKQQVSSYAELLLITTDLEAREESLKRQLENSQRLAATFTSLEADLDRLPTSLPALFNLVQNYEDASKLLYDLKVELIREENARSLLSTELPLYILGFKWFWGVFTGFKPSHSLAKKQAQYDAAKNQIGSQLAVLKEDVNNQLNSTLRVYSDFEVKLSKLLADKDSGLERYRAILSSLITKVRAIRLRLAESFRIRLELDRIFPELFQANPRKELVYVGSSKGKDKAFEKPNLVSRAEWFLREMPEWLNVFPSLQVEIDNSYKELNQAVVAGSKRGTNIMTDLLLERKDEIKVLEQHLISVRAEKEVNLKRLNGILDSHKSLLKDLNSSDEIKRKVKQQREDLEKTNREYGRLVERVRFTEILTDIINQISEQLLFLRVNTTDAIALERERLLTIFLPVLRRIEVERATSSRRDWFREIFLYTLGFKWFWGLFTGYAPTVNIDDKLKEVQLSSENLTRFEAVEPSFKEQMVAYKTRLEEAKVKLNGLIDRAEEPVKQLGFSQAYGIFKREISEFIKRLEGRLRDMSSISIDYRRLIMDYISSARLTLSSNLFDIEDKENGGNLIKLDLSKPSNMSRLNANVDDIDSLGIDGRLDSLIRAEITNKDLTREMVKLKEQQLERMEGYMVRLIDPARSLSVTETEKEQVDQVDVKDQTKSEDINGIYTFDNVFALNRFTSKINQGLVVTFYSLSGCPYCKRMKKVFNYLVGKYPLVVAIIDLDSQEGQYEIARSLEPSLNHGVPYLKLSRNGVLFKDILGSRPLPEMASYLGFDEPEDLDYSDITLTH